MEELISTIIRLITLICFFVLVGSVNTIKRILQKMERQSQSKMYVCNKCKEVFEGKKERCPKCKTKLQW